METHKIQPWIESRSRLLFILLAILLLLFASVKYFYQWKETVIAVLVAFMVSALGTLLSIVLGADILQKRLDAAARRLTLGQLAEFWMSSRGSVFDIFVEVRDQDGKRSLGFDTMCALTQITSILTRVHGDALIYRVLDARVLASSDTIAVLDSNVVLLGGDRSIPLTVNLQRQHKSRYRQDCSGSPRKIIRLEPAPSIGVSNKTEFETIEKNDQLFQKEYGLVSRIPIPNSRRCLFIISGNHGVGTYATSLAISDPGKFPPFNVSIDKPAQALFQAENIRRSKLPDKSIEVFSPRGWEEFPDSDYWPKA